MATATTPAPQTPTNPQTKTTHSPTSTNPHRRIDLQSPADLQHLINAASRAARTKIDLHLPLEAALRDNGDGAGAGVDSMRAAVEREVQRFIDKTFEGVRMGVSVNGVEGDAVDWTGDSKGGDEFEPYDYALAQEITSLYSEVEELNLELATTRRTAAQMASRNFESEFLKQSTEGEEELEKHRAEAEQQAGSEENVLGGIDGGFEGRGEDVQRTWQESLKALARLQEGLPETRRRAESAKKVVDYMEGR